MINIDIVTTKGRQQKSRVTPNQIKWSKLTQIYKDFIFLLAMCCFPPWAGAESHPGFNYSRLVVINLMGEASLSPSFFLRYRNDFFFSLVDLNEGPEHCSMILSTASSAAPSQSCPPTCPQASTVNSVNCLFLDAFLDVSSCIVRVFESSFRSDATRPRCRDQWWLVRLIRNLQTGGKKTKKQKEQNQICSSSYWVHSSNVSRFVRGNGGLNYWTRRMLY